MCVFFFAPIQLKCPLCCQNYLCVNDCIVCYERDDFKFIKFDCTLRAQEETKSYKSSACVSCRFANHQQPNRATSALGLMRSYGAVLSVLPATATTAE